MLTTYARIMDEYRRRIRLEAQLGGRESDRRDQDEVRTWTRYRGTKEKNMETFEPLYHCSHCKQWTTTPVNRIGFHMRRCQHCGNIQTLVPAERSEGTRGYAREGWEHA